MSAPSRMQLEGLTVAELPSTIECDGCGVVVDLADVPGGRPADAGWLHQRDMPQGWHDDGHVSNHCPKCRVYEETEQATLAAFGGEW